MKVFALVVAAAALALVGCDHRKPAVSDKEFAAFRAAWPGMTQRCLDDYRYKGMLGFDPDNPDCFAMTEPQRWSGVWVRGFEWTNFCPDPASTCSIYGGPGVNWLVFGDGAHPQRLAKTDADRGESYHIEFIGRRTKFAGGFGHLGQYDHMLVVDKVISLRRLPEPAESPEK